MKKQFLLLGMLLSIPGLVMYTSMLYSMEGDIASSVEKDVLKAGEEEVEQGATEGLTKAGDEVGAAGNQSLTETTQDVNKAFSETGGTDPATQPEVSPSESEPKLGNEGEQGEPEGNQASEEGQDLKEELDNQAKAEAGESEEGPQNKEETAEEKKARIKEEEKMKRDDNKELDDEQEEANKPGKLKRLGKGILGMGKGFFDHAVNGVLGGALMNIPAALQAAALTALKDRAALLTLASFLSFSNMVLQIPDCVIDVEDPANSLKVYFGVPVDKIGQKIGSGGAAVSATNLVSGPSKDNKISQKIDDIGGGIGGLLQKSFYAMMTLGKVSSGGTNERYSVYEPQGQVPGFFDQKDAHIIMMYPTDGFSKKFGEYGINDAMFSGFAVDLNTGLVLGADGPTDEYAPVQLLGSVSQGSTVEQFLEVFENQLKSGSTTMSFEEYSSSGKPSEAFSASKDLVRQFSTMCLQHGMADSCMMQNGLRKNIMANTLQSIAAGVMLSYDGKQIKTGMDLVTADEKRLFSNQDVTQEIAKGALGSVTPVQGMGSGLKDYLQTNFPQAKQLTAKDAGAFAVIFKNSSVGQMEKNQALGVAEQKGGTSVVEIQGAPAKNYAAQGLYVYESSNTPFARHLQQITGVKDVKDYIVFLDENLQVVPLQAAQSINSNHHIPQMLLNQSKIKYWQSLISYDLPDYQRDGQVVLYTLDNLLAGVQGAEQALQKAASSISKEVDLAQQIAFIKAAEMQVYKQGPFYAPYNIKPVEKDLQLSTKSGQVVIPYVGAACYPLPQNPSVAPAVTDYLVPFMVDENGKTVTATLPNHNVSKFISLVSDISFNVFTMLEKTLASQGVSSDKVKDLADKIIQEYQKEGLQGSVVFGGKTYQVSQYAQTLESGSAYQKVLVPDSFANSQLDKDSGLQLDTSKPSQVFLQKLEKSGLLVPQALKSAIAKAHQDWVNWLEIAQKSPLNTNGGAQLRGIDFGLSYTLRIVDEKDFAAANFMYSAAPSPSGIADDLYVATSSLGFPQNSDLGLELNYENPQPYIVSLATGFVYDQTGSQAQDDNGKVAYMNPSQVASIALSNQKKQFGAKAAGPTASIKAHLANIQKQGQQVLDKVEGPFEFGPLVLHARSLDLLQGNYLYFTKGQDGQPAQYYVGLKAMKKPFGFGQKIDGETQYMVNVVTGQLFTRSGASAVWPNVSSLYDLVSGAMHISDQDARRMQSMISEFAKQQEAEQKQLKDIEKAEQDKADLVDEDLKNVAANVNALSSLAGVYANLRQDAQGKYYRVTQGPDGKPVIFDFNATSKEKDSKVGAMIAHDGSLITTFTGYLLDVMRKHAGVKVDEKGQQSLAVPQTEPTLALHAIDQNLQPGKSGTALLASNNAKFPSSGIGSIGVQGINYYFYYHVFMKQYFVYVDDPAKQEQYYVNMKTGATYHINGVPRIAQYPVAQNRKGQYMLVRHDEQDMLEVSMQDATKQGSKELVSFENQASTFSFGTSNGKVVGINELASSQPPYTAVKVAQFPLPSKKEKYNAQATAYNVYWPGEKQADTYQLRTSLFYENLTHLPLDIASGNYDSKAVSASMQQAQIIRDAQDIQAVVFGLDMYTPAQEQKGDKNAGQEFTNAVGKTITVQEGKDSYSGMSYMEIVDSGTSYAYGYDYEMISQDQLKAYMADVWNVSLSESLTGSSLLVKDFDVSKLQAVKVPQKLHTSSVTDVQGVPAVRRAGVAAAVSNVYYALDSGRFVAKVPAGSFTYFNQAGYVDLAQGVIFDDKGDSFGYSLLPRDLIMLLDKVNVVCPYDENRGYRLAYRSVDRIEQESSEKSSDEQKGSADSQNGEEQKGE